MNFVPGVPGEASAKGRKIWLIGNEGELLIGSSRKMVQLFSRKSPDELGLTPIVELYLGNVDGTPCHAALVKKQKKAPKGFRFIPLRLLFDHIGQKEITLLSRAIQLLTWMRSHRYCGRCATPMETRAEEWARFCPACGYTVWPRISPAMIVAVRRDDKLLLAKAVSFKRDLYSVLAGFVEPGESLEDCVRREVREEVGIEVENIRYVESQSWPFPHSLMVAFTADYRSGEITIDEREILEARWCTVDEIASIPGPMRGSVARKLIDDFVEKVSQ